MKLLWLGDLGATGFGTVTSDVGREFVRLGADIRFVSQNDFDDLPEPFLSRTLDQTTYTTGAADGLLEPIDHQGITGVADFIPALLAGTAGHMRLTNGQLWGDWKPDACFMLGDFYGARDMATMAQMEAHAKVPTFHYVPVEGHDLPPLWKFYWDVIKPIAMSKFGQAEIEKVIGYQPPLVYHGVDADAFHPVSTTYPVVFEAHENKGKRLVMSSKSACKYALVGQADFTMALRVDRFMPRKGYGALLRAMAPVMRERPNLVLYLHCRDRDFGGYLPDLLSKFPDIAQRVINPQFGSVPRSVLLAMYNAADLYVSTSAEGFGLTIAEAIACGVPAVGLDYSAVPEVIGPAGTVVPVGSYFDNEYGHFWALPDEAAFGRAVAYLVDHPHRRLELGRIGPQHVARNFRWDVAAEQFMEIAAGELDTRAAGIVQSEGPEPITRSLHSSPRPAAAERIEVAA